MKLPGSEPYCFLSKITGPRWLELPIARADFDSPFEFEPPKFYFTIFKRGGNSILFLLQRTNDAYNELRSRVPWTSLLTNSTVIIFKGLSFQNTLIRNCFALLFLLVPGQDSQENLLFRQALCTNRAWQFHSPG